MNIKAKKAKVQALSKKSVINVLSQDEIKKKVQVIEQELKASTWRELETKGKFEKNDKLSFNLFALLYSIWIYLNNADSI